MKLLNFIKIVLAAIVISSPSLADTTINPSGGTAWNLYVMGGGYVFYDILIAIKLFASSGAFVSLTLFTATLGFLIMMAQSVGELDGKKIGVFFFVIWFVSYATNELKVNILIVDTVLEQSPTGLGIQPVDAVPAIIGLPAAAVSEIGEAFTKQVETVFSHPSTDLKFTSTRQLNMEARVLQDLMTIHPFSPELTKSLGEFYTNCVYPQIANGTISLGDLIKAPDFMTTHVMPALNDAQTTADWTNGGTIKSCKDAWNDSYSPAITSALASATNSNYNAHPDKSGVAGSGTLASLTSAILSNVSSSTTTSASSVVKQRSLFRSFNQGTTSFSGQLDSSGNNVNQFLIEEQAILQQKEGWRMAIEAFNSMSSYIFTVLHAFILGISPLIIVLAFIPGIAGKIILNYMQVLFWLALWQPMLAVVNYIIISFQESTLRAALNYGSSTDALAAAAPQSWMPISEAADKFTLAAGFLGTMVPMISWGLVKGGMAFSQFISSGIGTSVAQGAAKNLATGSLSMDSKSFNSTSANKHNVVSQHENGISVGGTQAVYGNAHGTNSDTGLNTVSKDGDKIKFSEKLANSTVEQNVLKSGEALSRSNNEVKQQAWNQDYAKLRTLESAVQNAEGGQGGKAWQKATDELDSFRDSISKADGGSYLQSMDRANQFASSKNAAYMLLTEGSEILSSQGATSLSDALASGKNVSDEALRQHFNEKYNETQTDAKGREVLTEDAMNLRRSTQGLTQEQAANEFIMAVNPNPTKARSEAELETLGIVSGTSMLGSVSAGLASKIGAGGIVPQQELKGTDTQAFKTQFSMDEKFGNLTGSERANAIRESLAEDARFFEQRTNSDSFKDGDSENKGEKDSTTLAIQNAYQRTKGFEQSVTDAQQYVQSRDWDTVVDQGGFNNYIDDLFDDFKPYESTTNGSQLNEQREFKEPSTRLADEDVGGATGSGMIERTSTVTGAEETNFSGNVNTVLNKAQTEEDGLVKQNSQDIKNYKGRIETEEDKAEQKRREGVVANDNLQGEVIARGVVGNESIKEAMNSKIMDATENYVNMTAAERLSNIKSDNPDLDNQGAALIAAASGGTGNTVGAELSSEQQFSTGKDDMFTATGIQFEKVDGQGIDGVQENLIYTDSTNNGSYQVDVDGHMERVGNFPPKTIETSNGESYEEYGKTIDGEMLYKPEGSPNAEPMTQQEIESTSAGVVVQSPDEIAEQINISDLNQHVYNEKTDQVMASTISRDALDSEGRDKYGWRGDVPPGAEWEGNNSGNRQ